MAVTVSTVSSTGTNVINFTADDTTVAVLAKVLRRLAVPAGDPNGLITSDIRDLRNALKDFVDDNDDIAAIYENLQTAPSASGKGLRLDSVSF